MRTRSSSNLPGESSPNPTSSNLKRRNRRHSKQPFILEESPADTMADQRTMVELLRATTEGYAEAIVVPPILAEHFELKHSLINMMTSDQFFGLEKYNPHDHIRWFNKITSTIKYKDVPNSAIKLILFPFSLAGAARRWLEKEPLRSILTWEDLAWDRYKDLLRAYPHHGFTELHQLDTFYNALNPADQDSLNSAAGGNLLERRTQDVLTIIENKSKVHNSRNKLIVSQVKSNDANPSSSFEIAKLIHAVNQQTIVVTTAMTAILKRFQATPPPAFVKAVEEICVTCGAAVNYNQGNSGYRPPGPLPSNTISNPKGELKAITTQSGIVLDVPFIPMPPPFINPEEDERVEETLTDSDLGEDPFHFNIPYPSRMQKQKQQDKDEIQIHKFWQMFKQLHINITLANALILIPKYQKILKALIFNKEKHLELADTPLNENCLAVILKKLPEKLGDPGKFLIPCGFSELKCKALANLGASINLMPLSVWKKLCLPKLISTCMTLELANRAICTPAGIARDVFVLVGKFTFPANFVIVDYERDPRVPLILGRPFLRIARALIDVYGEEMIFRDGDERLTLNMRHDTSSYSNQPQKESINMINIYDDSCEDYLEDLFVTDHPSGNPTFSSHTDLTSPELKDDIFDLEGDIVLIEKLLNLDSTKDLPPPYNIDPLSGSTTSSSPDHLLEEFAEELALITFPPGNNDLPFDIESDLREIEYLLNHDPTKEMNSILEDSIDEDNLAEPNDNLFDTIPEMFTDERALNYSSSPLYDEYDDDLFEFESDVVDVYNDPFDSKGEKIKESKLLIDELDFPKSSDFLPSPEYDLFFFEVTTRVAPDKNVKKIAISHASLILEDFDPPLYELYFHKEVPWSETLLSFSFENEEKVFKPRILTSKGVHTSLILELSHWGPKPFKVTKIVESPVDIFPCSFGEHIRILDVLCLHFYPS
uniref:Reverse transcriptase domain-containing protein n=1 Tax=Tanacetum cinerariifolium TaxID=118510 RepID=A0A699IEK1_TANCI|nr:reverse transcriptase domain-containing protein [Tanacetum cinerariifolium]